MKSACEQTAAMSWPDAIGFVAFVVFFIAGCFVIWLLAR